MSTTKDRELHEAIDDLKVKLINLNAKQEDVDKVEELFLEVIKTRELKEHEKNYRDQLKNITQQ